MRIPITELCAARRMDMAWIWYGPDDPVSLSDIRQTGATTVSTALYDIPAGDVWPLEQVLERWEQ